MNAAIPQPKPMHADRAETWYKIEAEYLRDCRQCDTFSSAMNHFLDLKTPARLIEMIGADINGKIIVEKN